MLSSRHTYRTYGLNLACNVELPCIATAPEAAPDFVVEFAGGQPLSPLPNDAVCDPVSGEFGWRNDCGHFHTRYVDPLDGSRLEFAIFPQEERVKVQWDGFTVVADIPRVLLGTIAARLLQLKGIPALHANAVSIAGGAVLICGDSGSGKSSTTAALIGAGYPLLSDDIAALDLSCPQGRVRHGYPHLRLWPDSARSLGQDWENLPLVFRRTETMGHKCYRDLAGCSELFCHSDLPLRAIYILKKRVAGLAPTDIECLPARLRVPALLRSLYIAQGSAHGLRASYLSAMAELANQHAIYWVRGPSGLDRLPELAAALASHACTNER